jgi:hypothetical protein
MNEVIFFVSGAVFTLFAVGLGIAGAIAYQDMVLSHEKRIPE